ncbi:MAG: hypothetical protein A2X42_06760 [Candidatus Margulisbacteria bacterium GWF2_38_17]|nr:MAG: hypothetical protein A2X42_06760 [Candidatus Margulisbacteria bacterium GWF2_38_17]
MVKIGVFVQAQYSDENCFIPIKNKPSIEVVLEKAKKITENVILTVADEPGNQVFDEIASKWQVEVFKGNKDNIAQRFLEAAKKYQIDVIIRIPAVKPCFNELLLREMLNRYLCDYPGLDLIRAPYSYYQNFAMEIYSTKALIRVCELLPGIDPIYRYKPHYFVDQQRDLFNVSEYTSIQTYTEEDKNNIEDLFSGMRSNETAVDMERPGQGKDDFFPAIFEVRQRYGFFEDRVMSDDVILDIACGNGYGTITYKNAGEIIGVDYDISAIENARNNASRFSHISYIQDDANTFIRPGFFTKIFTFETIEHLSERSRFLQNMFISLKDCGYLFISTPVRKYQGLLVHPHHLYEYTPDEFEDFLMENGFVVIEKYSQDFRGMINPELNQNSRGMLFVCMKRQES